jgi:conjugative relaxase-like TrwC/TraI family protein
VVVSVSAVASASGAAAYYAADNYYTTDQSAELSEWGGEGAARLGLDGKVDAARFEAVLGGNLPNGAVITGGGGDHRAGLDLTFSAPKSVSLVALIGKDERVIAAHIQAVCATMAWAESRLARARQGANGKETLETGNLIYALFPHNVSRSHDPQLHVHAVIANVTQRPDGEWRALRNDALFKENTLIGAVYHAELRASLEKLGYKIELTGKHGSFEIAGIDRATISAWSTRHNEIKAVAKDLDITSPKGLQAIAERTRETKTEMSPAGLAGHWSVLAQERGLDLSGLIATAREATPARGVFARVNDWGRSLIERVTHAFGPKPEPLMREAEASKRGATLAASYAVAAGVRHLSERQASFEPYALLRAALNFSEHGARVGDVETRITALISTGTLLVRDVDGIAHMTTRDLLRTETGLVSRTRDSIGSVRPLVPEAIAEASLAAAADESGFILSDEQARAASAILTGPNRYQLVQGDAGTGKTTLFALVRQVAETNGIGIMALSPQNRLANELRADTGLTVDTVAGFLSRHQRATGKGAPDAIAAAREALGGKILLVDEASMISHRQMLGLMQIADNAGIAKLVLVGDAQQISSPEAGRPFALLQQEGFPTSRLSDNRRQHDPIMRDAVAAAKHGNIRAALDLLGSKVHESDNPADAAARAWLNLSEPDRAHTAIFTSGHKLRADVLDKVRSGLITSGALGKEALTLQTYENLNLTSEQMRRLSSYAPGQRLELFERQLGIGLARGQYAVRGVDRKTNQIEVSRGGIIHHFDPARIASGSKGLALSVPSEIEIRQGDRLLWTRNDKALGIANGSRVDVVRIDGQSLIFRDAIAERHLAADNPLRESVAHGLVLNMHRAQGLTVDRAITVMDSHDRQLNSASLFYVLASRAREHIGIHVDSKAELVAAIGRHGGEPLNARDLFPELRGVGMSGGEAEPGATVKADAKMPAAKPAEIDREPVLNRLPEKYLGLEL